MMKRIAIVYCGGCNPLYDRVAEVDKFKTRLPGHVTLSPSPDEPVDLIVAVMGCPTACADLSRLQEKRVIVVRDQDEFKRLEEKLNDL
jgi:hypothetical protein